MKDIREFSIAEKLIQALMAIAILIVCVVFVSGINAHAADSALRITEISYADSTIVLQMDENDNALFISDGKQKQWEYVPVTKAADNTVTLDISWISASKDYVISFKGNYSTSPISTIIPKQVTNLKATYSTLTGTVSFTNDAGRTVEWKKRDAMAWQRVPSDPDVFREQLVNMCSNGASLVFRLAGVNGTSVTNPGFRPSKEIALTIPKKTAAPNIVVKDELLAVPVEKGMQYRYVDEDSNPLPGETWKDITSSRNMPLTELAPKAMCEMAESGVPTEDVYIQFRTKATTSKQVSFSKTIEIPAQSDIPASALDGIDVVYTSTSTFEIKIPAADTANQYEYCIINQDDISDGVSIEDFEELKWKSVTSKEPIVIDKKKDKVEDGSEVWVRRKAQYSLGEDDYEIASPSHYCLTVRYPGDVTTQSRSLEWLSNIEGVCNVDNSAGYMTFTLYSPTETVISGLKFVDYSSSAERGSVTYKSSVQSNASWQEGDPEESRYIITTVITSTENLDKYASDEATRRMRAYYLLGSVWTESTEEDGGIALFLYPATKQNNPSTTTEKEDIANELGWEDYRAENDKIGYTTAIKRIYNSNRIYDPEGNVSYSDCDPNEFRVKIDFGTIYEPERQLTASNGEVPTIANSGTPVEVTAIKYDGVKMNAGDTLEGTGKPFFKVEYASSTKTVSNKTVETRYAVITLYADAIEKKSLIDARNTDAKVYIYLSNGEILDSVLTMNLRESATLEAGNTGFTMTPSEIEARKSKTVTDSDGKTSTTYEINRDYVIRYSVLDGYSNLLVKDVTFGENGPSVLLDTSGTSIYLSVEKIQAIELGGTLSNNLVIEFDNGFKIEKGCKLILSPGVAK